MLNLQAERGLTSVETMLKLCDNDKRQSLHVAKYFIEFPGSLDSCACSIKLEEVAFKIFLR